MVVKFLLRVLGSSVFKDKRRFLYKSKDQNRTFGSI